MSEERKVLASTVTAHALIHVCELTFPATALMVTADLLGGGKEYGEIGLATFVFGFLFGASALPGGWLVDRLGARTVLVFLLFGTGAAMVLLALSPNFWVFATALGLLGAGAGIYHPVGTTMLSLGLTEHGKAMGYHGVGGNIGLAVTPFFAAAMAGAVGWRWAYAIIGALPILLGTYVLVGKVGEGQGAAAKREETEAESSGRGYLLAPLVLLFIMAVFNGMTYRGLMTFLPAYFSERVTTFGEWLEPGVVGGAMTTAILTLGVVGQYVGGRLADRVKKEVLYVTIFFVSVPLLFLIGRFHDLPLVGVAGLFALFYFMSQPVGNAMIPAYTSPRSRGIAFGLFFFMAFGVGSIMGWIAGYVGEKIDLSTIFTMLAACTLISAFLGIGLVAVTRKAKQ